VLCQKETHDDLTRWLPV